MFPLESRQVPLPRSSISTALLVYVSSQDKKVGQRTYDAVRIAIGKKVFYSECRIAAQASALELFFRKPPRGRNSSQGEQVEHCISLNKELLDGIKYYCGEVNEDALDGEVEQLSFLALLVEKTETNQLKKYSNWYKPIEAEEGNPTRFVLVEFRSDNDLLQLVEHMSAIGIQVDALDAARANKCSKLLLDDSRMDRQRRLRSIGSLVSRINDAFLTGRKQSDILVIYPFDETAALIETAADGLDEVRGVPRDNASTDHSNGGAALVPAADSGQESTEDSKDKENIMVKGKGQNRSHFTIAVSDYERLGPEEFLNDTLIDFWMRWYVSLLLSFNYVLAVANIVLVSIHQDVTAL
jgi:hypothetical protein